MSGRVSSNGRSGLSRSSTNEIRPIILFDQTPGERAKEIDAPQRTLSRKADEFERSGMQSLFRLEEPRNQTETSRSVPEEIRQLIVDLHREMPTMSWREIAAICFIRTGRKPSHHSVKRIATSGSPPPLQCSPLSALAPDPDPAERQIGRYPAPCRRVGQIPSIGEYTRSEPPDHLRHAPALDRRGSCRLRSQVKGQERAAQSHALGPKRDPQTSGESPVGRVSRPYGALAHGDRGESRDLWPYHGREPAALWHGEATTSASCQA